MVTAGHPPVWWGSPESVGAFPCLSRASCSSAVWLLCEVEGQLKEAKTQDFGDKPA
jgi:hypothetical protein